MKKLLAVLLGALFLSGCIQQISPSVNTTDLTTVDFAKSTSWKEGKACRMQFLIFPAFGLASAKLAAESVDLKKVKLVEQNFEDYIILKRQCVMVYGE